MSKDYRLMMLKANLKRRIEEGHPTIAVTNVILKLDRLMRSDLDGFLDAKGRSIFARLLDEDVKEEEVIQK